MKSPPKPLDKIEEALIATYRKQEDLQLPPAWRQQVLRDISSKAGPTAFPEEKPIKTVLSRRIAALAATALAAIVGWVILANLDWYDPWISLKPDMTALGSHAAFWLEAGDRDSGLRRLKVTVIQKEMEIEVLSRNFEQPGLIGGMEGEAIKKVDIPLTLDTQALGLQQGKATIVVTAHDLSWRNGFKGRVTILKKELVIDHPPSP
jgi:hypothetical protein